MSQLLPTSPANSQFEYWQTVTLGQEPPEWHLLLGIGPYIGSVNSRKVVVMAVTLTSLIITENSLESN